MPRIHHGTVVTVQMLRDASADDNTRKNFGFLLADEDPPLDPFKYLFPDLQANPNNRLPEDSRAHLIGLGLAMRDTGAESSDSEIPAAYTYLGQFLDHDITLEAVEDGAPAVDLFAPNLQPLTREEVEARLKNGRTATLDLDSLYARRAPREGEGMALGSVTPLGGAAPPTQRPGHVGDESHDLPRDAPNANPALDRRARIGDERNDENTIIAQLHLAFLRAHNALTRPPHNLTFIQARKTLRQHYQFMVLRDFLPRIVDPATVEQCITQGNRFYNPAEDQFFMPLEFSVGAYRFGHTMVRADYNFNLNFGDDGGEGVRPATLAQLFDFTALQGDAAGLPTLPDNWIIEWARFFPADPNTLSVRNKARRLDTHLVEPLFSLTTTTGRVVPDREGTPADQQGAARSLAVRNLLRGFVLGLPTGQAVAGAMGVAPLTPDELRQGASEGERVALEAGGFLERTPLWYYVLAEAAQRGEGKRLGPVGGTIVAEVLTHLVRRTEDSILPAEGPGTFTPTLGAPGSRNFILPDLLRLAGVLT